MTPLNSMDTIPDVKLIAGAVLPFLPGAWTIKAQRHNNPNYVAIERAGDKLAIYFSTMRTMAADGKVHIAYDRPRNNQGNLYETYSIKNPSIQVGIARDAKAQAKAIVSRLLPIAEPYHAEAMAWINNTNSYQQDSDRNTNALATALNTVPYCNRMHTNVGKRNISTRVSVLGPRINIELDSLTLAESLALINFIKSLE